MHAILIAPFCLWRSPAHPRIDPKAQERRLNIQSQIMATGGIVHARKGIPLVHPDASVRRPKMPEKETDLFGGLFKHASRNALLSGAQTPYPHWFEPIGNGAPRATSVLA